MEVGALDHIRRRSYEHKGVRLTEDAAKAERLVELLCLKWGVKKISREMNISPHTVRAARRLLTSQGRLDPYKKRVVDRMEDAIEAAVEHWANAVEEGRVPVAQIPVGMAIMFDKRALAMGEPTSISGATVASQGLTVDDLNAYLERLPSCKIPVAADIASTENCGKAVKTDGFAVLDVGLDVGTSQPSPDVGTVDGAKRDGGQGNDGLEGGGGGDPAGPVRI